MTQMPQSDQTSGAMSQDAQGETPAPAFRPYLPSEQPPERSRLPLVFIGLSVLLVIGGLVFWATRPDTAEAERAVVNYRQMTAEQLAENASVSAARELVRRLSHGTAAERAAASSVTNRPRSARLARNLAMAMALKQQKRAYEMRLRVQRNMRMAEEGR